MDRRNFLTFTGATAVIAGMTSLDNNAYASVASNLQPGSRGAAVKTLQNRLNQLGYWCGPSDGVYGEATEQAVMAVQKANGIDRDGICGKNTSSKINSGYRPSARSKRHGRYIEIDKNRQIILFVENGTVKLISNTSTGDEKMHYDKSIGHFKGHTPTGTFNIYRRDPSGWEKGPLGPMWKPTYFTGGVAIHGSTSIPGYPASHGCCRVSVAMMDHLWSSGWVNGGTTVTVY